jgi:hypothetical protein
VSHAKDFFKVAFQVGKIFFFLAFQVGKAFCARNGINDISFKKNWH